MEEAAEAVVITSYSIHYTKLYDKDITQKLIDGGIPENKIAVVNGPVSKKKRKEISDMVSSGEIRVVIGLTDTLGTGTNMQENLRAMHHLDAPWMPGELEQRNGRGHRQGNRWNTVFEYRYITEGIDARRWQVLAKKQKIIVDFLKAKDGVRSVGGDVVDMNTSDLDEINSSFSDAAGDARILIREKLRKDIDKLERKKRTHGQGIVEAKEKARELEEKEIPALKRKIDNMQADLDAYQDVVGDKWEITLDGKVYTDRKEASAALEKITIRQEGMARGSKETIGHYRGFDITVQYGINKAYSLEAEHRYFIQPAIGSIDYLTRNFAKNLADERVKLQEKESSVEKFKQVAKEPFAQEDALQGKKDMLDQVEQDMAANPDAPPTWLSQGVITSYSIHYTKLYDEHVGRQGGSGAELADDGAGRTGDNVSLENYHIADPESIIGGTPKVRFQKNQNALETFSRVSSEGRNPTDAERDALAAYIGWGSFGQELFQGSWERPVYQDGWKKENDWLRDHLGESAWKSAQSSIINAHYTDPPTVMAMWDIAKRLGFKGGRVLEPSMGVGNFFGLMPKTLKAKSDLTGIELDETTAGIAKMLYPAANIQQMGYQESKTGDGFYDLVIGRITSYNVCYTKLLRVSNARILNQFIGITLMTYTFKPVDYDPFAENIVQDQQTEPEQVRNNFV